MPPEPREANPAPRARLRPGLEADPEPGGDGTGADQAIPRLEQLPAHKLLHVSPLAMKQGEPGGNMEEAKPISVGGPEQHASPGGVSFIPLSSVRPASRPRLDMDTIRQKLAGARGRHYWRTLYELAETEEFQQYLEREFPMQAPRDMQPLSRREF